MFEHRSNIPKTYTRLAPSPKHSFLSPANKFGQRSFSASSLPRPPTPNPQQGSLR